MARDWLGKPTVIKHPEGRLIAMQQQMFLAQLFAEKLDIDTEDVLRKLAISGLCLTMDVNEIAVDAATVMPTLKNAKAKLRAVPEMADDL